MCNYVYCFVKLLFVEKKKKKKKKKKKFFTFLIKLSIHGKLYLSWSIGGQPRKQLGSELTKVGKPGTKKKGVVNGPMKDRKRTSREQLPNNQGKGL